MCSSPLPFLFPYPEHVHLTHIASHLSLNFHLPSPIDHHLSLFKDTRGLCLHRNKTIKDRITCNNRRYLQKGKVFVAAVAYEVSEKRHPFQDLAIIHRKIRMNMFFRNALAEFGKCIEVCSQISIFLFSRKSKTLKQRMNA